MNDGGKGAGERVDLIVVGAGSAGFSAAITAAERGAKVALIGAGTIGGTCVNIGCVPSKTLIRAAESIHHASAASRFRGIRGRARLEDWAALIAQKDELVGGLRRAKYIDLLPRYPAISYHQGEARITAGGVRVNGREVRSERVILATGARPAMPSIAGIEGVPALTSTTALALTCLPASLLVVGGGYIGCELAQMFARVGVEVTLLTRRRLLPDAEPEISTALAGYLSEEGVRLLGGLAYRHITAADKGVALTITVGGKEETLQAAAVLAATGRRPNTEGLGLAEAGIAVSQGGAILVDDRMRTTRPGTYAAGDVTGRDQFVYMAAYGARIAAENALGGDGRRYDARAMPAVVFTDPQVASCGLTEAAARAKGLAVKTTVLGLDQVPRAIAARDPRGLIKLVAGEDDDRLLGAHLLAPEGADSIGAAALAIRGGLTAADLAETILPYLTTVEGLKLAAQTFSKDVSRLSCCAG